jgi:hypothetical protein
MKEMIGTYTVYTPQLNLDEDTRSSTPAITRNSLAKKTKKKPSERTVKMSFDNFESCLVAWLHAIGEFNDKDDPILTDIEYDEYENTVHLMFRMEEIQLELFKEDPLGR